MLRLAIRALEKAVQVVPEMNARFNAKTWQIELIPQLNLGLAVAHQSALFYR